MHKFLLFIGGLVAIFVLIANLGPMVLLALSVWLLYIVFKKFMESNSTAGKIGWVIVGLLISTITFSNIYALLGVAALFVLYWIVKNWNNSDDDGGIRNRENDPFTNFEREWEDLNQL